MVGVEPTIFFHLNRPIACSLNLLFQGTPMLYFFRELKYVCIGRTISNPILLLFINIGMDTMASYVGSSLLSMSCLSYPNTNSPLPYVSKNTQYWSSTNGVLNSIFLWNIFVPYLRFVNWIFLSSCSFNVTENLSESMYFDANMFLSDSSQIGEPW